MVTDKPFMIVQEIDIVALHPDNGAIGPEMLSATQDTITTVFGDFLEKKGFSDDNFSVIDGFLFLFNGVGFEQWHTLNWWEQRKRIRAVRDHELYTGRAHALLQHSCLAPYIDYSDEMVARSTEQVVKHAWMRKRLVLKECFWNGLDTISHAAYFKRKYQDMIPALCVMLCNVRDKNGRETELALGIDNGAGFLYKKKSRESSLLRFLYKVYKFFFRRGVFYIGGLELGLQETESLLSCHGSGAVVYQGWE